MKPCYLLPILGLLLVSCATDETSTSSHTETAPVEVTWLELSDALKQQRHRPKPIFIDLYTDWCRWCKVMDQKTFSDPEVAAYLQEHFYPVKFNAEKAPPININGKDFKLISDGRKSMHSLAYALMKGDISYPSYVILDDKQQTISRFKGFRDAQDFMVELQTALQ
jgi:thioredoxin-related protein